MGAIAGAQLEENVAHVRLHGVFAHAEPMGNYFVGIFSIIRGGFYEALQEAPSGTSRALEAINSGSLGEIPLTRSQMYS